MTDNDHAGRGTICRRCWQPLAEDLEDFPFLRGGHEILDVRIAHEEGFCASCSSDPDEDERKDPGDAEAVAEALSALAQMARERGLAKLSDLGDLPAQGTERRRDGMGDGAQTGDRP